MPADYTARPLDDPSLIGKGVPFELGWKSEKINSTAKSPTKLPTVSGPRRLNDPASVIKKFQVAFQFYASWHQPAISQQESLALLRDQVHTIADSYRSSLHHQADGTFIVHKHTADGKKLMVTVVHSSNLGSSAVRPSTNTNTLEITRDPCLHQACMRILSYPAALSLQAGRRA